MPLLKEILPGLREKHGSQTQVAEKLGIRSQLLGQYERGERNPKLPFYKKWKEVFKEDLQKLVEDDANVSRGAEKPTPVQKPTDNKVMEEEVYRNIVEGNTEYLLIPKVVFQEKYRLVSLEQFQKDEKELERRDTQIAALHDIIKQMTSGGSTTSPSSVPSGKTVKVQKT